MYKMKHSGLKAVSFTILFISFFLIQIPDSTAYAQTGSFPGSVQYTVRSGDTLYYIALSNNTSLNILMTVNGLTKDLIMPGQVLNIPVNTGSIFSRYTVVSGDSLYNIAGKFGVTVWDIMNENDISSTMIIPGQVLTIPFIRQSPLATILGNKGIDPTTNYIDIVVDKSDHTLMLFANGTWLKTYHVELGSGGLGDKQVNGDMKTPEGTYYICQEEKFSPADQYLGTRWMRLSYPNTKDAVRGLSNGIIDWNTYSAIKTAIDNLATPPQNTPLGEGVGIHGGSSPDMGSDWTWGCIGLTSSDAEDFFNYVGSGTNVYIQR